MKFPTTLLFSAVFAPVALLSSAEADVIAATDFDGRTVTTTTLANDTATGLNWVLNGVDDPGNMTAVAEDGRNFPGLFDANPLTQNLFAPAINVGNSNIGWRTTVALTVSAGSTATLTDVTFLYAAINSGQNLQGINVPRRSDFTITVFDPSQTPVGSAFVDDTLGDPTPISAVFDTPIPLTAPGTYTLEIFADEAPETGNHIGIDNLSINGSVTSSNQFVITAIDFNPETSEVSLTWKSRPGESYAVKLSKDLRDWDADLDDGILGDEGETTTRIFDLSDANLGDATRVFFRVEG